MHNMEEDKRGGGNTPFWLCYKGIFMFMLFSYVWKGGYMTVETISDVSQILLQLEISLKQTS